MIMNIDKNVNVNDVCPNNICGIYCISNSKYFYVGLAKNIRTRWRQHQRALRKGTHDNIFMQRVYNKYNLTDPFEYKILCECEQKDLGKLEVKYFDEWQQNSGKIALNERPCGLDVWDEEKIAKARASHKGKKHSEETRRKISEGQKGNIRPEQRVPIVQLSLEGELIKIWDSCKTAKSELGININLNRKQSGGYQWQRYSEYLENPKGKIVYDHVREVCQYSKSGEFIRKYNSIQEASDFTGIRHCNISNTLTGKQKTAGGYIWK